MYGLSAVLVSLLPGSYEFGSQVLTISFCFRASWRWIKRAFCGILVVKSHSLEHYLQIYFFFRGIFFFFWWYLISEIREKNIKYVTFKNNVICCTGIEKQRVFQFAAAVCSCKPPEVYKGKGILYLHQVIKKKQGKKSKWLTPSWLDMVNWQLAVLFLFSED